MLYIDASRRWLRKSRLLESQLSGVGRLGIHHANPRVGTGEMCIEFFWDVHMMRMNWISDLHLHLIDERDDIKFDSLFPEI